MWHIFVPFRGKELRCLRSLFLFSQRNKDVAHLCVFRRKGTKIRAIFVSFRDKGLPFRPKEQRYRSSLFLSAKRNQDVAHLCSFRRKGIKIRQMFPFLRRKESRCRTS